MKVCTGALESLARSGVCRLLVSFVRVDGEICVGHAVFDVILGFVGSLDGIDSRAEHYNLWLIVSHYLSPPFLLAFAFAAS
jgi:hypothetical protein